MSFATAKVDLSLLGGGVGGGNGQRLVLRPPRYHQLLHCRRILGKEGTVLHTPTKLVSLMHHCEDADRA